MRQRLDHVPPPYQEIRNNWANPEHRNRTLVTGAVIANIRPGTVLDPACGDGSILEAAYRLEPFRMAFLSDISEPAIAALDVSYPNNREAMDIFEALEQPGVVDMVILCETLEHMEDPDAILRLARGRASCLVASSPLTPDGQTDPNPEHLWQFDARGYGEMLIQAGWTPVTFTQTGYIAGYYQFQIWVAE